MRKFILITTMVLVSAAAQAGAPRGLTLASNDAPAAAVASKPAQANAVEANPSEAKPAEAKPADVKPADVKPADAAPVEAPRFVERPAAVDTKTEQAAGGPQKPAEKTAQAAPKAAKPKHRHESTEARVIYELHRHGIYW